MILAAAAIRCKEEQILTAVLLLRKEALEVWCGTVGPFDSGDA
jgi:hypothetical protein